MAVNRGTNYIKRRRESKQRAKSVKFSSTCRRRQMKCKSVGENFREAGRPAGLPPALEFIKRADLSLR